MRSFVLEELLHAELVKRSRNSLSSHRMTMVEKKCLTELTQLMIRCDWEGDRPIDLASDERMRQSLQWRQPLPRIHLQYLLDEVNELVDFSLLILPVVDAHHVKARRHR